MYLDSFSIEYIECILDVLNKVKDKPITHKTFKIQSDGSIMCGFNGIAFIEYMIAERTLLDHTSSFSPNDYQENDKIIYKYFTDKYRKT